MANAHDDVETHVEWYSWDEIVGLLEEHEGWGVRVEICEAGTE